MKILRTATIAVIVATLSARVLAQGIPVMDVASIAQQIQQVMAWAQQYQQMTQQYQMLTNQLNAVTGARGMGQLLNAPSTRQHLPTDFVTQFDQLRSLGSAGATPAATAIYNSIRTFDCASQFPTNQTARLTCESTAMVVPTNVALINASIASSQGRVSQLQGMVSAIDTAQDAKAAQDLSNRINAEVAILQNEKMMMDMALVQRQQQERLLLQQQREAALKAVSGGGWNPFKEGMR